MVIGGGTAGNAPAVGAAGLGASVALVERHRLGGDCLNTGCVPSEDAHQRRALRAALPFGEAMARVRRTRAAIAPHDSAHRVRNFGVDVFFGEAAFDERCLTGPVGGQPLRFAKAVIARAGARPAIPGHPRAGGRRAADDGNGLHPHRGAATNGDHRPAGPIGCELAQAIQRLGVEVILFHDQPRLLEREDPDASAVVERALQRDGVRRRRRTDRSR